MPSPRCARGDARAEARPGGIGFRCARSTPPSPAPIAPFPRDPPAVPPTVIPFIQETAGTLLLSEPLSEEARANTFVICAAQVIHLGRRLATTHVPIDRELGGGVAARFQYEAPCVEPSLVLTTTEVRAAEFLPLRVSDALGDVTIAPTKDGAAASSAACTLTRAGASLHLTGHFGHCTVKTAGDLDGDGVVDFVVEHMVDDPCLARTVLLSTASGWRVFASGVVWCPD